MATSANPYARVLVPYTFVFTDLAQSTRLWERHPAAMGAALARHDTLLRDAIAGAGGTVVKSTGDGLHAVFGDSGAAVSACLAAQIGLGAETWGETGPLRVRMGIHVGDAEPRGGDFYGPEVNRAARIMAAGHGGQVLLSADAARAAGRTLPDGATLLDLGEHRLKDLAEPERLFQLVHPDITAVFPELVTLSTRPNNLPIQVAEFFGRDDELAAITDLITGGARLVTLTGPGGTGKTRLALQSAAHLIGRFTDGVFFVDLSHEAGRESVQEAVLRVVGATLQGDETIAEALARHLQGQEMLLVMDNFEHVTAAAPDVVALTAVAPRLSVLVTSREALRVRGERVLPIAPMEVPTAAIPTAGGIADAEAVRLFVDRARAVRPDFELTDENAAAVAGICVGLDGLPLAIELAAARLALFSPEELHERLRGRLDVLGSGARDLPARQRTIHSTIAWSHGLLDADESTLFASLSVFATARLATVERVAERAGLAGDVLTMVGSLIDKSLVRRTEQGGRVRVSMLRTIRDFAAERLAERSELGDAVRAAHAGCYADLAADLAARAHGPGRADALTEIEAELGNFATAWAFWRDAGDRPRLKHLLDCLWAFHDARGSYAATLGLTRDLLDLVAREAPGPERLREEVSLRTSLARALIAVRGHSPEVEEALTLAVDLVADAGEMPQQFPVLRSLATLYAFRSRFENALRVGHELLRLATEGDDDDLRCEAHFVVGANTAFAGDIVAGLEHLDRSVALFDPHRPMVPGLRVGAHSGVMAHTTAGFMRWWTGHGDQAVSLMDRAVGHARTIGHPYTLAYALYHVAYFDLMRGELERPFVLGEELRSIARTHDYPIWQALGDLLGGIGQVVSGDAGGFGQMSRAMADYEALNAPPVFWGPLLGLRAHTHFMAGDLGGALPLVAEAREVAPVGPDLADMLLLHGQVLAGLGERSGAEEAYREAIAMVDGSPTLLVQLAARTALTALLRADGRDDESEALRAVLDRFTEGFGTAPVIAARALLGDG